MSIAKISFKFNIERNGTELQLHWSFKNLSESLYPSCKSWKDRITSFLFLLYILDGRDEPIWHVHPFYFIFFLILFYFYNFTIKGQNSLLITLDGPIWQSRAQVLPDDSPPSKFYKRGWHKHYLKVREKKREIKLVNIYFYEDPRFVNI